MEGITHGDKIALVHHHLKQIIEDADKLDPQSVDEILWELENLANWTSNRRYAVILDEAYDSCSVSSEIYAETDHLELA
jgi:hypothetical protein